MRKKIALRRFLISIRRQGFSSEIFSFPRTILKASVSSKQPENRYANRLLAKGTTFRAGVSSNRTAVLCGAGRKVSRVRPVWPSQPAFSRDYTPREAFGMIDNRSGWVTVWV